MFLQSDDKLINNIKDLGFEVKSHRRDGVNGMKKVIKYESIPSIEIILGLLKLINKEYVLSFFDYYHTQISDPGAYCNAVVISDTTVSYMEGNHGWTSKWKEVSLEDFALFIQKNWDKDDGSKQFENCILLEHNKTGNPK